MLYLTAKEARVEFLTEYDGRTGKFAKIFGISDKRNKNGWRVTWASIKKHVGSFIGQPGIVFEKCEAAICDLDHTDGKTYEDNLKAQEPYRVSTIIDYKLNEEDRSVDFIHEFHDEQAFNDVQSGRLKFTSPSIWPSHGGYESQGTQENGLPLLDVFHWKGLHSAFVNNPAFGDEARVKATCEGEGCPVRLLSASINPLFEPPEVHILNNSLSACGCTSATEKMADTKKPDEIIAELTATNKQLEATNKDLTAKVKDLEAKARKAQDEEEEEEEEKKEEEEVQAKKAKAAESEAIKELKAKVSKLETEAKAPLVAKMVEARQNAGASDEEIEAFKASIEDKTFEQIKAQSAAEEPFYKNLSARAESREHFEFNGGNDSGALTAKAYEIAFGEDDA